MQTLTMTRLNQQTASVLDAVERGVCFQIIRHRKAVGYLTAEPPPRKSAESPTSRYDWDDHFRRVRARGKYVTDVVDWDRRPVNAR